MQAGSRIRTAGRIRNHRPQHRQVWVRLRNLRRPTNASNRNGTVHRPVHRAGSRTDQNDRHENVHRKRETRRRGKNVHPRNQNRNRMGSKLSPPLGDPQERPVESQATDQPRRKPNLRRGTVAEPQPTNHRAVRRNVPAQKVAQTNKKRKVCLGSQRDSSGCHAARNEHLTTAYFSSATTTCYT